MALNGRHSEAVPAFTQSIASWDAQAKASPTANAREVVQTLQAANTQFPPTRDVWLNLGEAWA